MADLSGIDKLTLSSAINFDRTSTAVGINSAGETIIGVTSTAAPRAIVLDSDDVVDGRVIWVKDESGGAATNNITVSTEGAETIDGAATFVISTNYGVMGFYSDGSNWFTIDSEGSAGGLTYFTESEDSGTQITDSLTATGTNANFAIVPNGTGAIIAGIPNGASTGGNARGNYAVDLQTYRTSGTHVASGTTSVIAGGQVNISSGNSSTVGGGKGNDATGDYSTVAGGFNNSATATSSSVTGGTGCNATGFWSAVAGGGNNTASGVYSFIGAGYGNAAAGDGSAVIGGARGTSRGINGIVTFSASYSPIANSVGVTQISFLALGVETTDATATVLTSDGDAATTDNQIILPNNSAFAFKGQVVAGVTGAGDSKSWDIDGLIKRGANAASTTLVGSNATSSHADAGASTWSVALAADTTNGGLKVTVTGQAATTIRWVCKIETTETTY